MERRLRDGGNLQRQSPCEAGQWLISVQHDADDIDRFVGILPLLLLPSGRNSGTPPTSTSSSRLLPALFEVGGQPRRRGLAAPGRAEQGEELAAGCLQVDLNDRDFRETLGQRGQLNPATGRLGYLPFSRSVRASSPLPRPGAHSNPS